MKSVKIDDCCDNIKKSIELLENEKVSIREEIDLYGLEAKESKELGKALEILDKITEKLEKMIGKGMIVFDKKIVGLFDNKTKATLTLFDKDKWVEE